MREESMEYEGRHTYMMSVLSDICYTREIENIHGDRYTRDER